jgi:hypothetical protein
MTAVLVVAAVVTVALLLLAAISPAVLVRLVARAYPAGNPRREELVAEIRALGFWARFFWALELVEVTVRDALPERRKTGRRMASGSIDIWFFMGTLVLAPQSGLIMIIAGICFLVFAATRVGLASAQQKGAARE